MSFRKKPPKLNVVSFSTGTCYRLIFNCSSVANSRYRTFDGSCNNLNAGRTAWGAADRALARVVAQPAYADGAYIGDSLRCWWLLSCQPAARITEGSKLQLVFAPSNSGKNIFSQIPAQIHANARKTGRHIMTNEVVHAFIWKYDTIQKKNIG